MPLARSVMVLALFILPCAANSHAAELCTGLDPRTNSWGLILLPPELTEVSCPPGMAVMAQVPILYRLPQDDFPLSGTCCPLPSGSLTQHKVYQRAQCPAGFVITGQRRKPSASPSPGDSLEVECTEIDRSRFELQAPAETLFFDTGSNISQSWLDLGIATGHKTSLTILPPELRFGLGRMDQFHWLDGFCAGFPWGSPATGLGGRGCSEVVFGILREINPASSEPVCRGVRNIYSAEAACIR